MKKNEVICRLNPTFLKGICHRGYWNEEITENSMSAFKNAREHNAAFELDVHLTKDNDLIICHDSELERTTNKKGIIEELTVKEIKENYTLLNGEKLSTLTELLAEIKEEVPIVIELKVYKGNHKALANKLKEQLKDVKDKKNFMIISFDPRALIAFGKCGFVRQLLVVRDGKHNIAYILRFLFESVDLDKRFITKRGVRKYYRKHLINFWTIEDESQLDTVLPYCDTVTFQHFSYDIVKSKLERKHAN